MQINRSGRILMGLLTPLALGVLFLSVGGFGARLFWLLELTTHFKVQYLLLGFLLLPGVLWTRCRWLLAIVLFGIGLNGVAVLPWYIPTAATLDHAPPITIAFANVLWNNTAYDQLIQWVAQQQPDVVVLEEITPSWEQALTPWDRIFPYQLKEIRQDAFGIAIYSRIPLTERAIHTFGPQDIPWLETRLNLGEYALHLWALHPFPPVSAEAAQQRNALLREVSQTIQEQQQKTKVFTPFKSTFNPTPFNTPFNIVVGDLNTSIWSPFYQDFESRSHLKNTRQGFGIQPTWPTYNPLLFTPLDHILVSPDLNVHQAQAGPFIGSDHLPVLAIVSVPKVSNAPKVSNTTQPRLSNRNP